MVILKDSLKLNKFDKKLKIKMPQDVCLFLFRRDLRLDDNIALLSAIDFCKENDYKLITGFIFTPEQINSDKNKYFSHNSVQFMITSLKELNDELQKENGELLYYSGTSIKFIESIHKLSNISLDKFSGIILRPLINVMILAVHGSSILSTNLQEPIKFPNDVLPDRHAPSTIAVLKLKSLFAEEKVNFLASENFNFFIF